MQIASRAGLSRVIRSKAGGQTNVDQQSFRGTKGASAGFPGFVHAVSFHVCRHMIYTIWMSLQSCREGEIPTLKQAEKIAPRRA